MSIESLLEAIEEYMEAKRQIGGDTTPFCSDWDCGLAVEFEPAAGSMGDRQRLDRAKSRLERALDEYIDSRVKSLLEDRQNPKDQASMKI